MKRSEFKQLLKECLLEILTEEPVIQSKLNEAKNIVSKNQQRASNNGNPIKEIKAKQILRSMVGADDDNNENVDSFDNPVMMEHINMIAAGAAGGNKKQAELMKSIFADTALNTLPNQKEIAKGVAVGSTMGDMNTEGVNLDSLFHEGDMTRWANVAFKK
jgi:hypothetical protein